MAKASGKTVTIHFGNELQGLVTEAMTNPLVDQEGLRLLLTLKGGQKQKMVQELVEVFCKNIAATKNALTLANGHFSAAGHKPVHPRV